MKEQYGLFKANGVQTRYSDIACTGLTKMNIRTCDSLEELHELIDNDNNIPASSDYIILRYWEYFKPIS